MGDVRVSSDFHTVHRTYSACRPIRIIYITTHDLSNRGEGLCGFVFSKQGVFKHEIAPVLTLIYQRSIDTGILPLDWKQANISPIFKKGERSKASNYRPVSLTSVACKIIEHILHSHIMKYLDKHKVLNTAQHGFRSGHSCETQLIQTIHDFTSFLNYRTQTDVVIMDFSKAHDLIPFLTIVYC